ncbi:uncharacterized protein WCI35_004900, partial [Daubentonia madagascariensis]
NSPGGCHRWRPELRRTGRDEDQNSMDPGKPELTVSRDRLPSRAGAAQHQVPRKDFPLS